MNGDIHQPSHCAKCHSFSPAFAGVSPPAMTTCCDGKIQFQTRFPICGGATTGRKLCVLHPAFPAALSCRIRLWKVHFARFGLARPRNDRSRQDIYQAVKSGESLVRSSTGVVCLLAWLEMFGRDHTSNPIAVSGASKWPFWSGKCWFFDESHFTEFFKEHK